MLAATVAAMRIFRDPTLALTTAMVVGLAGLTGAAWAVGDDTQAVSITDDAATQVATWRSYTGQLLRLQATGSSSITDLGSQLSEHADAQAQTHRGSDLGRAWADARLHATRLAEVDTDDHEATHEAVDAVVTSADVLAAVVFDGAYRSVTVGGHLDNDVPGLHREQPRLPDEPDPAWPPRPRVEQGPAGTPSLDPSAPSVQRDPPELPDAPVPAPSLPDPEELSP